MRETLQFGKFEDAENMTILFQTYNLKYANKTVLFQKLIFCYFAQFLQILGCWLQISQSFFLVFSLKIPKRILLVSNLRIFIFARNFFKLTTQNYTNKAFLVPKLKLFVLHNLFFHKIEGADFN